MNLPNAISLARFLCVPVVVWLILVGRAQPAFALFVLAGVSDAVDGWVAKRLRCTTALGEYLDAIADKTLIVAVFATLGVAGQLPAWLVILVLFRDFVIVGGWLLLSATAGARRFRPAWASKVNTAAQLALAASVLAEQAFASAPREFTELLVPVVAVTTLASGAVYLWRGLAAAGDLERLP